MPHRGFVPLDDPEYRQICDALIQKGLGGR